MVVTLRESAPLSMASIRMLSAIIGILVGSAFYLFGPTVTPVMQASATSVCNELAGGNYRSYRLDWVLSPRPHWSCWDSSEPTEQPVDLGWWVSR